MRKFEIFAVMTDNFVMYFVFKSRPKYPWIDFLPSCTKQLKASILSVSLRNWGCLFDVGDTKTSVSEIGYPLVYRCVSIHSKLRILSTSKLFDGMKLFLCIIGVLTVNWPNKYFGTQLPLIWWKFSAQTLIFPWFYVSSVHPLSVMSIHSYCL